MNAKKAEPKSAQKGSRKTKKKNEENKTRSPWVPDKPRPAKQGGSPKSKGRPAGRPIITRGADGSARVPKPPLPPPGPKTTDEV